MDDSKQNPLDLFADLITQMQPFDDVLMMDFPLHIETAKEPDSEINGNNLVYQSNQQQNAEKVEVKQEDGKLEKPKVKTKEAVKKSKIATTETQKPTVKRARKTKDIFVSVHL